MIRRLRQPALLSTSLIASFLFLCAPAMAGIDYLDPIGGWRYTYDGAGDAFGVSFSDALDGTWSHNQGDKWDGTAPGDALSNPGDPVGLGCDAGVLAALDCRDRLSIGWVAEPTRRPLYPGFAA